MLTTLQAFAGIGLALSITTSSLASPNSASLARGAAITRQQAKRLANEKRYAEAEKLFRRLALSPTATTEDKVNLGIVMVALGNRDKGFSIINTTIANAGRDETAPLSFHVGPLFAAQARFTDAKPFLDRAVLLNPESAMYHGELGYVLFNLGDFKAATYHYQVGHHLDPTVVKSGEDILSETISKAPKLNW